MLAPPHMNNKEAYSIDGKEYMNVKQMFNYYKLFLPSAPCYNTFYKRFRKWSINEGVQSLIVSNVKLYKKSTCEKFIEAYDFVTNYSKL